MHYYKYIYKGIYPSFLFSKNMLSKSYYKEELHIAKRSGKIHING